MEIMESKIEDELQSLNTYDVEAQGYDWTLKTKVLESMVNRSMVVVTLDNMFGYSGTFSFKTGGDGIVFSFCNAGNWDRFAEFCAAHGIHD